MSLKLMDAILANQIGDLEYGDNRRAKGSTAKLLLLALANHANDYGQSSFPGYSKLEINTELSRQGIADTLEALKAHSYLAVSYRTSIFTTNEYLLNIWKFPEMLKEQQELESSGFTFESQATRLTESSHLTQSVKPLDSIKLIKEIKELKELKKETAGAVSEDEFVPKKKTVKTKEPTVKTKTKEAPAVCPPIYKPLYDMFVTLIGRSPTSNSEWAFWMYGTTKNNSKGIRHFLENKISPDSMSKAFAKLSKDGITVSSPNSLFNTAHQIQRREVASVEQVVDVQKVQEQARAERANNKKLTIVDGRLVAM